MKCTLFLLIPVALCGQAFVDDVSFPGGLAPGGFAIIEGAFFDRTASVQINGRNAPVIDFQQYYCDLPGCEVGLIVQIPSDIPPGPAIGFLVAGEHNVVSFPITLNQTAPQFMVQSRVVYTSYFTGPIREDRTLPGGFGPWSCAPGETPKSGELARIYLTGLGATDPTIAAGSVTPQTPLSATLVKPSITIGGQNAEVVESVLTPGETGTYRITFRIPAGDGWLPLKLAAAGNVITAYITVGKASQETGPSPASAAAEGIQAFTSCGGYLNQPGPMLNSDLRNPPLSLAGVSVIVTDSQGHLRSAPMVSVASSGVAYIVPKDTAAGLAGVSVTASDGTVYQGSINVLPIAPRILEVSSGLASGYVIRVRGQSQTIEPISQINGSGAWEAVPIDLGPEGDRGLSRALRNRLEVPHG